MDKFNVNKIKPNGGNWGGYYEEYRMNDISQVDENWTRKMFDDVDGIHNMDTNDDWLKLMNDTLKFSKTKMITWKIWMK